MIKNLGAKIGAAIGGVIGLAGSIAPIFFEAPAVPVPAGSKEPSKYFKVLEPSIKVGCLAGVGVLTGAILGEIAEQTIQTLSGRSASNNP